MSKKKKIILCFLTIFIIAILTYTKYSKSYDETMRISYNSLDIKSTNDKNLIKIAKDIYENIDYNIFFDVKILEQFDKYTLWLEKKNEKVRIINLSIWIKDNEIFIFNKLNGKYGYLSPTYNDKLKEIIKEVNKQFTSLII